MNIIFDNRDIVLKTERLVLRAFTLDDLDDFFEYAKIEGVGVMAGWEAHKTKEDSREILDLFIEGKEDFAVEKDGKVIGSIGVHNPKVELLSDLENKRVKEIGFVLAKDYWRQGLMTEACNVLLEYIFKELDLDYVAATYFTHNKASKGLQEKLGFKPVGESEELVLGKNTTSVMNLLAREDFFF